MSVTHRMITRAVLVSALSVALAGVASRPALAGRLVAFDVTEHAYGEMVEYDLTFPVAGAASFSDTFYSARASGDHHAQDLMAKKMVPVVAVAAGTVRYVNYSRDPSDLNPERCCTLVIDHDDGWATWYLHLNNDTPGTDDGLGWGIAPGIGPRVHVEAGDIIGWVGDSGNAENTSPHLHFELHDPAGVVVNPYAALKVAQANQDELVIPGSLPEGLGLVDTTRGRWYLGKEGQSQAVAFFYGNPGDFPIVGDWDCDGDDTPGMYRQSDGYVYLRNSNTQGVADIRFFFGNPGDVPIAGDFDDDGCDTVSIYRPSEGRFLIINELGENDGGLGAAESSYLFGDMGDKPFVGDFDGDGVDTVGLHRESTGLVYFRNTHTQGVADRQFIFGDPGDRLIAGDWNHDGIDSPGVFRPASTTFYLRYTNTEGSADEYHTFGVRTWLPVAGAFWSPTPPPTP